MLIASGTEILWRVSLKFKVFFGNIAFPLSPESCFSKICANSERYRNLMADIFEFKVFLATSQHRISIVTGDNWKRVAKKSAVVGFLDRCLSRTRNLAASN